MTSVLVVSRNASLGMWLSRNGADVDESRPDRTDGWTDDVPGHAVLLLDLGTVEQAEQRLKALVSEGLRVPVLLIGGDAPEWQVLAGRFSSGLTLFRPPLNAGAVLEELFRLAAGLQLDTFASRPAGSVVADPPTPEVPPPLPQIVPVTRKEKQPEGAPTNIDLSSRPVVTDLGGSPRAFERTSLLEHAAVEVEAPQPDLRPAVVKPPAVVAPVPDVEFPPVAVPARALRLPPAPAPPQPVEPPAIEVTLAAQLAPTVEPATTIDWDVQHPPSSGRDARPGQMQATHTPVDVGVLSSLDLVSALQQRVDGLYSVNDVADFVLAEMVERSGATAGAALMRAGDMWLVEAGVGLRTLEGRLRVPTQHWLVRRVVEEELGLLVTRSDGSSHELLGAPLASWEHLAGVYLPQGHLLIILASAARPFSDRHLQVVRDFDEECKDLLQEAWAVRELARSIAPLAEGYFEA